ncbi:MAG TPA: Lrp/AsnC family transcriptional regulator [Actinomycetota bacterium]|nr:Lrp/AsnC family transcriptional regulator [Actinomycetota bacterium]
MSEPTASRARPEARGRRAALDAIDLGVLKLLAMDARMSLRRIARELGMSPPAITDRVARLEQLGIIRGYRAEIDRSMLGFPLVVYVGIVSVQGSDQFQVVERLRETPEVEDVHVVTGPKDVLVRLRLRDTAHLRDVLFERIWTVPGVDRTETFVSLGEMAPKAIDVLLIDGLLADGQAEL